MALLFMDSFDHYATADVLEKWTTCSNISWLTVGAYGRNSTNGLWVTNASNLGSVQATVLGGVSEVIFGTAIKPVSWAASQMCAVISFGSGSVWECGLVLLADMTLQPFVVTSANFLPGQGITYITLLGTPTAVGLQVGVWSYLEVQMKCDGSTGTCVVRLNGVEVKNLTGLDTLYSSASLTRIGLGSGGSSLGTFYFDDLVVMDTTGAANNAFLGDVTVSALYPNGAGTTSGWTPSAGANYDCVNEAAPNDDTDYNSTATLNAKDTYAMQDCAAGADIRAVQILAAVRKGAEGPGQVKLVTRSSSTDYDGAAQGIGGTAYSYVREIRETDPATAAAWSESGWNAVEIGLKKTG
jgi:hypothetical protein